MSDSSLVKIYIENHSKLIKFVSRIAGGKSDAEDIVQDAFFRLSSAPEAVLSPQVQMSYLFQIVRNLAIDHFRKQSLINRYSSPEEEGMNVPATTATPETTCINQAALTTVAAALQELPDRTRYAFEMYRVHGIPQKEIAKELGVSPTLVNFMIRDALLHCKKAMNYGEK